MGREHWCSGTLVRLGDVRDDGERIFGHLANYDLGHIDSWIERSRQFLQDMESEAVRHMPTSRCANRFQAWWYVGRTLRALDRGAHEVHRAIQHTAPGQKSEP